MAKINGTGGVDILNGTDDNDVIDGLGGADQMTGGLGHDKYYVENILDDIIELLGEGTDDVFSTVSYTLPDNVENLTLTGTDDVNATGNAWDNLLKGNKGDNILNGGDGNDRMEGGKGDDTYYINHFSLTGINNDNTTDWIIDSGGHDTVRMNGAGGPDSMKYIMQKELEDLIFNTPDIDCEIIGNNSANLIQTGAGDDTLNGGKGADTMNGGDGANIYFVDNKRDVIIDAFDDTADDDLMDTLNVSISNYTLTAGANVENIFLTGTKNINFTGSDTDNTITGNAKKNKINGGDGDDTVSSGGGKDTLWGGLGADEFYFDPAKAFTDPVKIMDFNPAQGDTLNIADILDGYDGDTILAGFIEITDKGNHSIVKVNASGAPNGEYIHIATLYDINGLTGEDALETAGTLITIAA